MELGYTAILAGGFGSGKTEIALNLAYERGKMSDNVVLADLDFVNPFFASREVKQELEDNKIRLIAPSGELSFGDVPHIPAELLGLLGQKNDMIIDLAGDEIGALVLGYISNYVRKRAMVEFLLVVNPYRPFAQDLEAICELKDYLEKVAKLEFTGIISNPNLVEETDIDIIKAGHEKVMKYAEFFALPIKFLTIEAKFHETLKPIYKDLLKIISLNVRPEWI